MKTDKLLTGMREKIFMIIAENPDINNSQLCSYSVCRGGQLSRIKHHLIGLSDEELIICYKYKGKYYYKIHNQKGQKMHQALIQANRKNNL